ncbi:hypothetical protein B0H19DRAFT_1231297 [Mycena capillaripes]|nr:hypothetical protein B0H19DRAFT_1231297 [Mycena capillaripes]
MSATSEIFSRYLPKIQKLREGSPDDEARREANSGLKKATEGHGRGGHTKFTKVNLALVHLSALLNWAQKPNSRKSMSTAAKTAAPVKDVAIPVGRIILLPNPQWPTEEDTNSDDHQEIGVASVPTVTQYQALRSGKLAVETDSYADGISFKEKWGAERIDKWMCFYFSEALEYSEDNHFELGEGEYHWVPLSADRRKLVEYKKDDELTGRDLMRLKTALRFPVPDKLWHKDNWVTIPGSDGEWLETSNKRKGKAASKGDVTTRKSARKPVSKPADQDNGQSDGSVVEVEGLFSRTSTSAMKIKIEEPRETTPLGPIKPGGQRRHGSPERIEYSSEHADIANSSHLFIDGSDSESESDFPLTLSDVKPLAAVGGAGPLSHGSGAGPSTSSAISAPAPSAIPPPTTTTPPAATDVIPAATLSAVPPSTNTIPGLTTPPTPDMPFGPTTIQSRNYCERTPPKRPLEATIGSGFPSPDRPANNPWKRRKSDN